MDGIINLCKPRGIASFKALSVVKRRLGLNKVGHLGTLDPAACGVLILLCGRATKLANQLHAPNKVYRALFTWGTATDTGDAEGNITATSNIFPDVEQIKAVLPQMVGAIEIEVPKYSAVHINGRRAYEMARNGIEFVPPKKNVQIARFELLPTEDCVRDLAAIGEEFNLPAHSNYFEIECETGTYIRSLATVLAQKLSTVAFANVIFRTRVGRFDIAQAKTLNLIQTTDIIPLQELQ